MALRDDDAEDDEGAGLGDKEEDNKKTEAIVVDQASTREPRAVQPTGRVVGVVKRNWRA